MHQEELGLLKKEIELVYEGLSDEEKSIVDCKLQQMPKIPGFPRITRPLSKVNLLYIFGNFWFLIVLYRVLNLKQKIGYQSLNIFV